MDFKSLLSKIDDLQESRIKTPGSFDKMEKSVSDRAASDVLKSASKSKSKKAEPKEPSFDTSKLADVLGGKLPKEKPGTLSKVHKTPDFEPDDDDGSEIVREQNVTDGVNQPRNLKEWMNRVERISEEQVKAPVSVIQRGKSAQATITSTSTDPTETNVLQAAAEILKKGKGQIQMSPITTTQPAQSTQQKPGQTIQSTPPQTTMTEEEIDEVAAPGQEDWIKANKQRFIDQYGKEKGLGVLYATAWKRSKAKNESINESKMSVMEGYTLEDILQRFPHEHKMCQEGWGLDESLYEALADHYHREGRIPYKVWHGPLEELRDHVTKCYAEDTDMLMDESVETASSGDAQFGPLSGVDEDMSGAATGAALGRVAGTTLGGPVGGIIGSAVGSKIGSEAHDMLSDDLEEDLYELDNSDELDELDSEFPYPDTNNLLDEEDYMMEAKKKNVKNKPTKVLESKHYLGLDNLDITNDFEEWSAVADGFFARIVQTVNGVKAFSPESNGLIGFFDNKKQTGWIVSDINKMEDDKDIDTNKYGAGDPLGAEFPDLDLLESKKKKMHKKLSEETKETKSGRVHKAEPGGYGRADDEDDEGRKVKDKDAPRRGRGRPRKNADSETGEVKKWDTETLARWIVGSKPDKLPGKASVKHKIKDESIKKKSKKFDAQMESWDRELKSLLNEGMTITTSTGQPGGMDSVSVSATDSDAQTLLRLLQDAGIGLGGKSSAMSHGDSDGQAISVEPVAHDEVMGQLTPQDDGGDDALGFIKRMLGARGSDSMDSMEMDYESEADHDHAEHDHEDDEDMRVKEGTKFTGELAKARADGVQPGEKMKVDGKEYPVKHGKKMDEEDEHDSDEDDEDEEDHDDESKDNDDEKDKEKVEEGQQTCNECGGAMYEGHQCEMEELNEWANSPMGKSADEDFKTEIEYMTRLISGGLNGQKRDQTTLPHTKVKTEIVKEDISATMRKLAGIK